MDFLDFWRLMDFWLRLLSKATEITTKHQKLPKIKFFFSLKGKKSLNKSPQQELEESPHSWLYLLVWTYLCHFLLILSVQIRISDIFLTLSFFQIIPPADRQSVFYIVRAWSRTRQCIIFVPIYLLGNLNWLSHIYLAIFLSLADPVKARGCSTNTSAPHSFIHSFIERSFSSQSLTAPSRPNGWRKLFQL